MPTSPLWAISYRNASKSENSFRSVTEACHHGLVPNSVVTAIRRRLLLGVLDDEVVSALRTFDRIEQSFQVDEPADEQTED